MQLWYNSVALHSLGLIENRGQQWDPLPSAEAPQRARTTLKVRLHAFEATFGANREVVDAVRDALKAGRATLRWVNETTGTTYYNGEASIGPYNWPDDGKGNTRHQSIELDFSWLEHDKTNPYLGATFQATGSPEAQSLGTVTRFSEGYSARRYSDWRSQRSGAAGRVTMSGTYPGDTSLSLDDRALALMALKEAWTTEVDSADGRLVYGDFDRTVRIEEFTAELSAGMDALEWTLAAGYSRFPNESSGVLAEYDVQSREEPKTGQLIVVLSGRVMAASGALCRAKIATIRATLLAQYSGATLSLETSEVTDHQVSADEDGDAFLETRFSETYKVSKAAGGQIVEWNLRMADDEDPSSGTVRRSYSGTVTAKASTHATAYAAAVAKARALGANKHNALSSGRVSALDAQQSADYAGDGSDRFSTVEFEWQYRLTIGTDRVWVEVSSELQRETFGQDRETVGGSVMASSAATARSLYAMIKAGYAGYLIEGEKVGERRIKVKATGGTVGAAKSPPEIGATGLDINAGEVADSTAEPTSTGGIVNPPLLGATYTRQWQGLTFGFTVYRPKTASDVAIRYEQETQTDYVRRISTTRYSGTVWAESSITASNAIDALLPSGVTWHQRDVREERGKFLGALASSVDNRPSTDPEPSKPGYLYQVQFSATYMVRLEGDDALIETELTDEYEHSGPRLVVRPTAFSRDVVQQCGIASGRRVIRGSAVASTEALAATWCRGQYAMAFSAAIGITEAPPVRYHQPPRFTTQPTWVTLQDGPTARGESSNVAAWRVSFHYEEILPTFDAVMT